MYARTPYLIEIAEAGQTGSKVELFIANSSTLPSTPTYVLKKNNPSATNNKTRYDIAPFVREFINNTYQNVYNGDGTTSPATHSAFVRIDRYKDVNGTFTLLNQTTLRAWDGYRSFTDSGLVPVIPWGSTLNNIGFPLISSPSGSTFYYPYTGASSVPTGLISPGYITVLLAAGAYVTYTEIAPTPQVATITIDTVNQRAIDLPVVFQQVSPTSANFYDTGNVVRIYSSSNVLLYTATFKPLRECRYTPVPIDFVNKYGGWQRVHFFKASMDKMNFTSDDYNFLTKMSTVNQWTVTDGQTRVMNRNGRKKITVNSGSVDESFKIIVEQILMSERIMVNGLPAKVLSNDIDFYKIVNKKDLNYTLEFEFSYDESATVY